jgi:glycosyltransferase involved in cell wall biosynthesis
MRLLHLLRSLDPATGGPIEAVRLLSLVHAAAGHQIEIASLDEPGNPVGELPFELHFLGPGRGVYGRSSKLVPWLRANHGRFDGVIVNGLWQYHGYACRAALHGTGTPYFVFPHGMLDPWFKRRYPLKHLKKWLYWPWGDYRVIRDAAATLFTCEEEKRLAAESFWLYRAHGVVAGLGTRAPEVDLRLAAEQLFVEHPQLRGTRIVLFMGRIHPKKGCDLLLQGFAQAFAGAPEWRLLMVGPDQVGWQAELENMARGLGIADRVCWAGARMGDSKWGALAAAEVFALPSHQENFGIAVAEALACGTPVLVSDKVNIWREIKKESAGLVASDTAEGMAGMLRDWVAMSMAERQAFPGRARVCFAKHFDIRGCAEAVLAAVREASHSSG